MVTIGVFERIEPEAIAEARRRRMEEAGYVSPRPLPPTYEPEFRETPAVPRHRPEGIVEAYHPMYYVRRERRPMTPEEEAAWRRAWQRAEEERVMHEWERMVRPYAEEAAKLPIAEPERPPGLAESLLLVWTKGKIPPPEEGIRFPYSVYQPMHPTTMAQLGAGIIASAEALPLSLAQILGIPAPRPPPTVIGGVVGKAAAPVISVVTGKPVETRELEAAADIGIPYAAGTILGDILTGILIGKGVEKAYTFIRGKPVATIRGVRELETTVIEPPEIITRRIGRVLTTTERVSPKTWAALREAERFFQPEDIALAGTGKYVFTSADDVTLVSRAIETIRPADVYLTAARKIKRIPLIRAAQPYTAVYTKVTGLPGHAFRFTELTYTRGVAPLVLTTKTAVAPSIALPTVKQFAAKTFTGVQLFGRVDPSFYLRFLRTMPPHVVQRWLPQMGGVTIQQIVGGAPAYVATRFVRTLPSLAEPVAKALGIGIVTAAKLRPLDVVRPRPRPALDLVGKIAPRPVTVPEKMVERKVRLFERVPLKVPAKVPLIGKVPLVTPGELTKIITPPRVVPTYVQTPKQIPRTKTTTRVLQPPIVPPIPMVLRPGKLPVGKIDLGVKKVKRRPRRRKGKYWLRYHPITTPSELARRIFS